ncbi:TetR/AcrR family transcriptional regulator [Psychrobacter sp. TAE2020]|uniref:TetR/AcrR family transcriptional regulator n=1 Tax=Psychrobacter sp. TAE2020 TaxID=2846762 RepID=UPI001C12311E|nr:TetR/AcrR family transcriptional regulator [Psychrobacter sp. TAE2020]MBU5616335.1 TetR/AcrR family transcriptional regulator [Psychrobacter sp. TAE2020]
MALRDTILYKSYEVFYQHGFHASGVDLLAKQAGTTKRTLYAHFGNKEGLIEAVLAYRHECFIGQLTNSLSNLNSQTTTTIAISYLEFLIQWTSSDNFYGCMFINACAEFASSEDIPHQIARDHKFKVRQLLLAQFKSLGTDNPQQKADSLFIFGEGIIVAAQTEQRDLDWDIHSVVSMLVGER